MKQNKWGIKRIDLKQKNIKLKNYGKQIKMSHKSFLKVYKHLCSILLSPPIAKYHETLAKISFTPESLDKIILALHQPPFQDFVSGILVGALSRVSRRRITSKTTLLFRITVLLSALPATLAFFELFVIEQNETFKFRM